MINSKPNNSSAMLTLFAIATFSTIALPSAAHAGEGVYVELDAGFSIANDQKFDVGTTSKAGTIRSATGHDIGLAVGYDLGKVRFELEASNRKNRAAGADSIIAVFPRTETGSALLPASPQAVNGYSKANSLMANAMFDFGNQDGLQGFIGGGVGISKIRINNQNNPTVPWLNSSDSGFAAQALAGVRYPLTDHVDIGMKYRYFHSRRAELVDRFGRSVVSSYRTHSVMATIAYSFGGRGK